MGKITSSSLIDLIIHADFIVQMVMLILVLASIWSWSLIFEKIIKFSLLKVRSDKFEDIFDSAETLEDIYNEAKNNNNHPLARIFIACMKEWKLSNVKKITTSEPEKKVSLKERLLSEMQVAANKSAIKMQRGLSFLAIIGSVAPFVGLLGTVWGIMNSFQGIAVAKNTSLAVVAPGIAEALLATAFGLFAAIPAVFFYNIFSNKINNFSERFYNFSIQLLNILSKELDR